MIRPITVVTFLMACGSGLYLYQSKHEVQVLDRTIEKTVRDTGALREQSRLLAAEWTMLNDPERLRQFSDTYLNLKSINPSQFTSLAELANRLPPVEAAAPADPQSPPPVAEAPSLAEPERDAAASPDALPIPPLPGMAAAPVPPSAPPPAVMAAARPSETKVVPVRPAAVVSPVRPPVIADARPSEPRPYEQRVPEQRAAPRIAEMRAQPAPPLPRPIVLAAPRPPLPRYAPSYSPPPQAAARAPYGGSLLGMARGSMPPAPRPTPVNATYNAN